MKRFFQSADSIVTRAMDGSLRTLPGQRLARANGFPHTKFVVRRDWDRSKVAIISGGGAGHEPSHIGFVGKGMLTAAVSGEVFASPSVEAVLSCILEVTGEAGCLLVVKNYTGDRLNFGLAAERAKELGKRVEMVIVADDIALPDSSQPRGIAGTLFVHKMAGYLSEQGRDLREVVEGAKAVSSRIQSLGFALSTCLLPGQSLPDWTDGPELGLGIHGEPGAEKVSLENGRDAVEMVLKRLAARMDPDSDYALLINNLGAVTPLEMSIIAETALTSDFGHCIKYVVGPAPLMTSLNMYGFSLSILKLDASIEVALLAPVEPLAWPLAVAPANPDLIDISHQQLRQHFEPSANKEVGELLNRLCEALIESEADLNELDAHVGDGDTGFTFANAARAVREDLRQSRLPLNETGSLLVAIGQILSSAMGGSSGVLNSIMLTRAGAAINEGADLVAGLYGGVSAMMSYGGAKQGDRTLLDALIPALDQLETGDVAAAAKAARQGAENTARMNTAKAGRSAYLRSDSLMGFKDPGAEAIARVFEALVN